MTRRDAERIAGLYEHLVADEESIQTLALGSVGRHPNWSLFFPFFQGSPRTFVVTTRRLLVFATKGRRAARPGELLYEGDPEEFLSLPKKRLTKARFGSDDVWVRRT